MPALADDLKPYATKQDVADAIKSALLAAFPVGTIIETKVDVNPGTYIGGTWEELPANLCLQTGSASEAGTQRSAGLPNITGELAMDRVGIVESGNDYIYEKGALYSPYEPTKLPQFGAI